MVYGPHNKLVTGAFVNQLITGGPHIVWKNHGRIPPSFHRHVSGGASSARAAVALAAAPLVPTPSLQRSAQQQRSQGMASKWNILEIGSWWQLQGMCFFYLLNVFLLCCMYFSMVSFHFLGETFRCLSLRKFFSKCFGSFLWSFMISLEWFGGFQGLLQVLAGFDSTCWYAAQGVIKQRSRLGLTYHQENTVNLWILRFRCFNPSDVFGSGPPVEENYPSSLWHVPTTLLATVHRPRKTGRYSAWAKWGHISYLCRSINDTLCPNTSNSWEKRQIRINQFGSKPCISKSLANGIPSNRCWPPKNGTPFHAT